MTKSNVQLKAVPNSVADIPFQPASMDIWEKKYRLATKSGEVVDHAIDDTYQRVARALADVETSKEKREEWHTKFLHALRHGAIPAGRITSNAGAWAYKPATSTINCTVSGTISDSMDDILHKVHEAGLTLKAGCGIGYEFSTLRPKGAFVAGAGAYTSGPLSFMDIFDKMCFTVSSAGGRRGAQMGTFDIGHPDVLDFIRAKREDGRLRQFNLSLLISSEFMEAVKADKVWHLAFPISAKEQEIDNLDLHDAEQVIWRDWANKNGYIVNDEGLVACKIYRSLPARRVWDLIMASTYDYAEPGFILIDQYNEMNNNWFCEEIRATNPCVTADTWVHTSQGPRQVAELIGRPFEARIDSTDHPSGAEGFFLTATKEVVRLTTREGYSLRLTADHRVRKIVRYGRFSVDTEWCAAGDLEADDKVLLNDHSVFSDWNGAHSQGEGYLMGLLLAQGAVGEEGAVVSLWRAAAAVNGDHAQGGDGVMAEALRALEALDDGNEHAWIAHSGNEHRLHADAITMLAGEFGVGSDAHTITPAMERASSAFARGLLRGLFDGAGVVGQSSEGPTLHLALTDRAMLEGAQRMLLRLGMICAIRDDALHLSRDSLQRFNQVIGFADGAKSATLSSGIKSINGGLSERYVATVEAITVDGNEPVYDVQVPGINTFDANGLHAHNCGEQGLPPYGACLLGSINLTKFVRHPFTEHAEFDWTLFREVVAIFTRMLDNVVEINGLPLPQQRAEIESKRRHGMGYLGLGSTVTMLRMKYGDPESVAFTEQVTRELAVEGWRTALELAKEKGPAPIMSEEFEITGEMLRKRPEMKRDGLKVGDRLKGSVLHAKYSRYMQQVAEIEPELVAELAELGARFTHHSSIAPTGTISLSLANNASNGIEPSFAHHYARNVIREGKKSKEKVDVFSFELLAYRELINPEAMPYTDDEAKMLPDYFISADQVSPTQHVDIQAAAQKWIDSSISKTANVPTEFPYEDFKDIYLYAYEQELKGCTTFRYNPEVFQGVLVNEKDLENTLYRFTLENGETIEVKGNDEIEYDGEMHSAANLYDALKEGYYGRF